MSNLGYGEILWLSRDDVNTVIFDNVGLKYDKLIFKKKKEKKVKAPVAVESYDINKKGTNRLSLLMQIK